MSVTLNVIFHTNAASLTEMHASVEEAGDMVFHIADRMGVEVQPADLSTFGHQGRLIRYTGEIVATYYIEEN